MRAVSEKTVLWKREVSDAESCLKEEEGSFVILFATEPAKHT